MAISEREKSAHELHLKASASQFACTEIPLGPLASYSLIHDPKHLAFALARYKFCAKMLEGKEHVVEVGFGDGFGLPIIAQAVKRLHCVDWDERGIKSCQERLKHLSNVSYQYLDTNQNTLPFKADAVYTIDVIEHIDPEREEAFMRNICGFLKPKGVLVFGTPNITSNIYASEQSRIAHINLKSQATLKELISTYFEHVFMFGMNDETLHTGYAPMCHYIWAIGAQLKEKYV